MQGAVNKELVPLMCLRSMSPMRISLQANSSRQSEVDMVLWPENAIDVNRQRFADSALADLVRAEALRLGVPFVVGVTEDAEFVTTSRPATLSTLNTSSCLTEMSSTDTSRSSKCRLGSTSHFDRCSNLWAPDGAHPERCDLWNRACCRRR